MNDNTGMFGGLGERIKNLEEKLKELVAMDDRQESVVRALRENEQTLKGILDASPVGIAKLDFRTFRWVNHTFLTMFGYSEQDVVGRSEQILYSSPVEFERVGEMLYSRLRGGSEAMTDARLLRTSGSSFCGHIKISAPNPLDPMKDTIMVITDVSWRRQAEEDLKRNKETIEALLNASPDLSFLADNNGAIITANVPFAILANKPVSHLIGKPLAEYFPVITAATRYQKFREVFIRQKAMLFEDSDGVSWFSISYYPVFDSQGNVNCVAGYIRDITEIKKVELERERIMKELIKAKNALQFQATHDALCNIWNRSAIIDILTREMARTRRENTAFGVMLADLDDFSRINEEHGHVVGDAVLRGFASQLNTLVRPYDAVGRYGGEEFLLVVSGVKSLNPMRVAERLRQHFAESPIETEFGSFPVTISMGVTTILNRETLRPLETIIDEADSALTKAKKMGKNRVESADEPGIQPE